MTWMRDALCRQVDVGEVFYPDSRGNAREAKQLCRQCPVIADCLAYALEHDEAFGIWGGLGPRERRALRRAA